MPAFVYWLAGYLAITGSPNPPTVGDIVAFTTLQSRLFFPLGQLLNVQVEVYGALALFDRIFEYLDLKPGIEDAPDAVVLDPASVRGSIRFRRRQLPLSGGSHRGADDVIGRERGRPRTRSSRSTPRTVRHRAPRPCASRSRSTVSTSRSSRVSWSRSWVTPDPARPRPRTWCPGCTTWTRARWRSTASMSARSPRRASATSSAWSPRRRTCSTAPCA